MSYSFNFILYILIIFFNIYINSNYFYLSPKKFFILRAVVQVLVCLDAKDGDFLSKFSFISDLVLEAEKLSYLKDYDFSQGYVKFSRSSTHYGMNKKICIVGNTRNIIKFHNFLKGFYHPVFFKSLKSAQSPIPLTRDSNFIKLGAGSKDDLFNYSDLIADTRMGSVVSVLPQKNKLNSIFIGENQILREKCSIKVLGGVSI